MKNISKALLGPKENGKNVLERGLFTFFTLFILFQCISIAVANIFFGISIFFTVLIFIKNFQGFTTSQLYRNIALSRYWLGLFMFFWIAMLLSAIFSGDMTLSLKKTFDWYIYRTFPFFIILFFFRDNKRSLFFILLALISCLIDIVVGYFLMPEQATRLKGIFGHPMTLAGFICISMPIACAYLFDWKQKISCLVISAVLFFTFFVGLLLNGTRGAWLAVALSVLMVGIWFSIKSWRKSVFLVLICAATAITFSTNDRFEQRAASIVSTTFQSNTERLCMWQSAWNMFKDHPFFGVGVGKYAQKYREEYILPQAKERLQKHAHSNIFHMLGQSGSVGIIGFMTLFFGIFYFAATRIFKYRSPYAMLLFVCTSSFFVQGLTEYNFGNSAVVKYYFVIIACLIVLSSQKKLLSFFKNENNA